MLDQAQLQQLYRYGYALTRDRDAAYDLLQDAVETGLRKAPRNAAATLGYLQRIMRNRFIDQYRHDHRYPTVSLDEDAPISIDTRVLEDIAIAEQEIDHLMSLLNPLERELLYFWAVEGCTAREIAERTDSPRGTVLSRIHRVRQKILRGRDARSDSLEGGTQT